MIIWSVIRMTSASDAWEIQRITVVASRFAIISIFNKKSLTLFFAKRKKRKRPKRAAGVKQISIKRSIPGFLYKSESAFRASRFVIKSIITAIILTIIKMFLLSGVSSKRVFQRMRPEAKSIKDVQKNIRVIRDSR